VSRPRAASLVVAAVAGVFGAALLPGPGPGLGFLVVAIAVAIAVWSSGGVRLDRTTVLFGALSLSLVAMMSIRAAEWLGAFNLLVALGLASLAVSGGERWSEVTRGLLKTTTRTAAIPAIAIGAAREIDGAGWSRRAAPMLRGGVVAGVLVAIFGVLFVSADRAFAQLATEVFDPLLEMSGIPRRIVTAGVVSGFAIALIACAPAFAALGPRLSLRLSLGMPRARPSAEWVVPLVVLDLLFAAFVAVQLAVLFGGHDYVLRTAGVTYAEYARSGFFQLLAVAGLALAVIGASVWFAQPLEAREQKVLKGLLGTLCLLTMLVLVSAVYRLGLYEEAFGFTRDRIAAHALALWLGGLFILVITAGLAKGSTWLPRTVVAYSALALMIFSLANPDALIARHNLDRYERTGKIDLAYLATLSADATPALFALAPQDRACVLDPIAHDLQATDGWTSFNLGRWSARNALEGVSTTCVTPLTIYYP
jgi:Domain of unknown function (DUF4173)